MNKTKEYLIGNDSREAIIAVSTQVRDIIGSTLSPAGRNYFLPVGITNDGRTIMEHIRFDDECQDQISLAYHEIARQQDKDGGDNTSTAMFMGADIVLDNISRVTDINIPSNEPVMGILRELEGEKDKAIDILKTKKVEVKTLEDLKMVAMTAMEDEEGANIIAEAVYKTGKDTFPRIDNGFNGKIETATIDGLEMPLKLENDNIFTQVGMAEHANAMVVVANHVFEKYVEITPLIKSMLENAMATGQKEKQPLVIVGKQFSIPFIQSVSDVVRGTQFPIILLSANYHNDTFEDIASFVDAKLMDTHPKKGTKITDLKINDAGFVKTIVSRDNTTQFIGGRGLEMSGTEQLEGGGEEITTRVSQRVKEIKKMKEVETKSEERLQMDRRIGALLGGITTVYVDAKTSTERFYLKKKAEDAINSCVGALNDGMVKGGGLAYKEVAEELGEKSPLYKSLKAPYERMMQNNGGNKFDLTNVYDSYKGMESALKNAVSTVKVLLTVEGIIANVVPSVVEEFKKIVE